MGFEPEDFPVTTRHSRGILNEKELIDYRNHREEFIRWLIHHDKDPIEWEKPPSKGLLPAKKHYPRFSNRKKRSQQHFRS